MQMPIRESYPIRKLFRSAGICTSGRLRNMFWEQRGNTSASRSISAAHRVLSNMRAPCSNRGRRARRPRLPRPEPTLNKTESIQMWMLRGADDGGSMHPMRGRRRTRKFQKSRIFAFSFWSRYAISNHTVCDLFPRYFPTTCDLQQQRAYAEGSRGLAQGC